MSQDLLLPKFLTPDIASFAIRTTLRSIEHGAPLFSGAITNFPMRRRSCDVCHCSCIMCHTVVLVPAMKDERVEGYPSWPDYQLHAHLLYEHSEHKSCDNGPNASDNVWPYKFDDIARCKALQLWHNRNDDRTDIRPHLLFPGDTPFWGGVKRNDIVVATSGVQPYFDKMISGMVADMCVAMAHDAWLKGQDHESGVDFLS